MKPPQIHIPSTTHTREQLEKFKQMHERAASACACRYTVTGDPEDFNAYTRCTAKADLCQIGIDEYDAAAKKK